jgi:hypothetical protein
MRRSEMLKLISQHVDDGDLNQSPEEKVLDALEKAGMLPPVQTCVLVDCEDGTQKHGPTLRVWDEE